MLHESIALSGEGRIGFFTDLTTQERDVLLAARKVRHNAYCPYSGYAVGAAVRSKAGFVYVGCNVERVSYSETTHAEQAAIDAMIAAEGPDARIEMLAFIALSDSAIEIEFAKKGYYLLPGALDAGHLGAPCGRCRQIIWEQCGGDTQVPIISATSFGFVTRASIGALFPVAFGPEDLK